MSFPDQRTSSGYVDLDAAMAQVHARLEDQEERALRERDRTDLQTSRDDAEPAPREGARARFDRPIASITTAVVALALVSLGAHAYAFSKVTSHDRAIDGVLAERRAGTAPTSLKTTTSSAPSTHLRGPSEAPATTAEALPEALRPAQARAPELSPPVAPEAPRARREVAVAAPKRAEPAPTTEATAAPAPAPSGPTGPADLGAAMRAAAAPSEGERPVPMPSTNLARDSEPKQLRPAPGAIVAAVRAVQDAARACLHEGDAPRVHTIHFGPDGRVVRVEPSLCDERTACIDRALARAHVDAFSEEGYRARVTVRP